MSQYDLPFLHWDSLQFEPYKEPEPSSAETETSTDKPSQPTTSA
jgi:hypothetical protein